jgi:hypothetical protein
MASMQNNTFFLAIITLSLIVVACSGQQVANTGIQEPVA